METARNKTKKKTVVKKPVITERDQNIASWIEDLESVTLNDWEAGFLASITEWWTDKGFLTDAQFDKLKGIWEKHQR